MRLNKLMHSQCGLNVFGIRVDAPNNGITEDIWYIEPKNRHKYQGTPKKGLSALIEKFFRKKVLYEPK